MPDPKPDPKPETSPREAAAASPQAGRTEMEELTVPVQVGADLGQLARAATANRTVGIDDDPENAAKLVEAVEDMAKTVELTVNQQAGKPLPLAARAAIAREKRRAQGASATSRDRAARTGPRSASDVELGRPSPSDPMGDLGLHTVTINDRQYSWTDDDEGSVPAEAREIHEASVAANSPTAAIPAERMP